MKAFQPRFCTALLLLSGCLLLTGCFEKLEQFLPKPPEKKVEVQEVPLSEEEKRVQETLEKHDVFTPVEPDVPKAVEFELNKSSIVSVLLYHDFAPDRSRNEMTISLPAFRAQLQALKDAEIPVIPMADLLAWKRGEKNIPDHAVVITIDDGWLGVYEYAFPILKEFGYPFTLYLYKNYVGIGGRSLTHEQIKEMQAAGMDVGNHSTSHQGLAMGKRGRTQEQYEEWLHKEIIESKEFLEQNFGIVCKTFSYPFGNKNEEVVKYTMDAGYDAAFTVNPQKITWDTPNGELPRFTQLGDADGNFRLATSFRGMGTDIGDSKFIKTDAVNEQGEKLVDLNPAPDSTIAERRPLIQAQLSHVGPVLPESIVLRLSGFGIVPATYDPNTQTVSYRVPQRIRLESCTATLSFRRNTEDKEEVISWNFSIDRAASYLPKQEFDKSASNTIAPASAKH